MRALLFAASMAALMLGHAFRIRRWARLIGRYERPPVAALMRALALGYAFNLVLPFRMGDLMRAWYAGRRMKNGVGLSLATVVVDRFLDIAVMTLVFAALWLTGARRELVLESARFYFIAAGVLLLAYVCLRSFTTGIKRVTMAVCSIFNDRIRLRCEKFFWSLINAFRDLGQVELGRMLADTALMWLLYIGSYALLGMFLTGADARYDLVQIVLLLFSRASLDLSFLGASAQGAAAPEQLALALYLLLPTAILYAASLLPRFRAVPHEEEDQTRYLRLLPQIDERDQLSFLDDYFSARQPELVRRFIAMNRDVSILADCSSGSNASTLLCMDRDLMFYRKYAFGADGAKLNEQLEWLLAHTGRLPLCEILRSESEADYCCYDMRFRSEAVGLFHFIHSHPVAAGERILFAVLDAVETGLYAPTLRDADPAALEAYIENKVTANLERIETARELRELTLGETLTVNHREYRNLPALRWMFAPERLRAVFASDRCADIHGDLTVENIICTGGEGFYLIDPNTGNLHNSPLLDYAKLLQSLHGGYEFMMKTNAVSVSKNSVDFISARSAAYDALHASLRSWLDAHLSPEQVRSVYYHELVHWLRLLPYKLRKEPDLAPMFYAGFITVANDVSHWFEEA